MQYRREIDGLRALAVLPVILFHAGFETFSGGFVGVDVFFVISGYLITTIIINELDDGKFSIINFYERRARRILPALFVVMLACLPFAWMWLLPSDMKDFSQSLVAVSLFASNILFWRESGYFAAAAELKPLLHTWSLAVEEQYYVLFPIFLLLTWRFGRRFVIATLAVIAIISLGLAEWGSTAKPAATFYLLPTRGWELLLGAFTAFYLSSHAQGNVSPIAKEIGSVLGLFLVLYSVFYFDASTPFPSLYTLAPTIGTVLIIALASNESLVGKVLGWKLFVGIGLISYSAYLWHQPLFAFARHLRLTEAYHDLLTALAVATFILAYITWKFIELPFRNKKTIRLKSLTVSALSISTLLIALGSIGHLTDGSIGREYDNTFEEILNTAKENGKNRECWARFTENPTLDNACSLGDQSQQATFSIVGDSHAGSLSEAFGLNARKENINGLDWTYVSCSPLISGDSGEIDKNKHACRSLRADFFSRIKDENLPPKYTLILSARWTLRVEVGRFNNKEGGIETGKDAPWHVQEINSTSYRYKIAELYHDSVSEILNKGYRVILIYPIPEMGWDIPRLLARIYWQNGTLLPSDGSVSHAVFTERNRATYEILDSIGDHPNLVRIKPESLLCNTIVKERCIAHINGAPLYYDDDHLSNAGAELIAKETFKNIR